ncbi:MAG: hypothetical protein ABL903_05090 [Methylococcales bacterium]
MLRAVLPVWRTLPSERLTYQALFKVDKGYRDDDQKSAAGALAKIPVLMAGSIDWYSTRVASSLALGKRQSRLLPRLLVIAGDCLSLFPSVIYSFATTGTPRPSLPNHAALPGESGFFMDDGRITLICKRRCWRIPIK